jgi:uncharacterized protein YcfJ
VAKTVTLPAGTVIPIRMTDTLDSGKTQPNTVFHGSLAGDLISDGMVVARSGAAVTGRVIIAKDATHFAGSSELSIELTRIDTVDHPVDVVTDAYDKQGAGRGKNTAIKTGGGAAVGAILGGLLGGGKGAAIGAASGGGLGAGVNGVTKGQQVQIPTETLVSFHLQTPISVAGTVCNNDSNGRRHFSGDWMPVEGNCTPALRLSKNISTRGPRSGKAHRRSLGFARDDKGEGGAHLSSRY